MELTALEVSSRERGGGSRQRGSVGVRATAERSEAVRGAEGAEKPLLYLLM